MAWFEVLKQYGILGAIVFVGLTFFYKVIWPYLTKQIELNREILTTQNKTAQERLDFSSKEFLKALERRDGVFSDLTKATQDLNLEIQRGFEGLHNRLDSIPNFPKRKTRGERRQK